MGLWGQQLSSPVDEEIAAAAAVVVCFWVKMRTGELR